MEPMLDQHAEALKPEKENTMVRPYSVLLADGHPLVRLGVKRIIEAMSGLRVVGEAGDAWQLLEILRTRVPDMIIVDISLPGLRDLEVIKKIKMLYGAAKIIFLSMHDHAEYLDYALNCGVEGFVSKENLDLELYPAIEKIRGGDPYISPRVCQRQQGGDS